MARFHQPASLAPALLSLALWAAPPAIAETPPLVYGICWAEAPGKLYLSTVFAAEGSSTSLWANAFFNFLQAKYGRTRAPGCHSAPSAAAVQAYRQRIAPPDPQYSSSYVETGWAYKAGASAPAASATPSSPSQAQSQPGAQAQARPPAGPLASGGNWACVAQAGNDTYGSALFAAPNDALTERRAMAMFGAHLQQSYGSVIPSTTCQSYPTPAAANAALQVQLDYARSMGQRIVATGWVYTPAQTNPLPTSNAPNGGGAAPGVAQSPTPVARPPSTPAAAPPTAPVRPSALASAAAPKRFQVVCYADADPHTRYYNPPVDGRDGDYTKWMDSYRKFMQQKYHYQEFVRCNKAPTLAEAQEYYETTLATARLSPSINGIPSPIVVTAWKYE